MYLQAGKRVKQARCETIESDGNCGEEEAYPSSKGGQCCSAQRNMCPIRMNGTHTAQANTLHPLPSSEIVTVNSLVCRT